MRAWGCESKFGSVGGLVREVTAVARRAGVDAAVVSKEALYSFSEMELLLAEHLATGARMKGEGLSHSAANEFLLWLAKERQVSGAIGKAGAKSAREFGIVVIGDAGAGKVRGFVSGLKGAGISCKKAKLKPGKADLGELERMAVSRVP